MRKKVKFCRIFRDKFVEKMADFAGIFEASFAEKRLVNNGRFHGRFPSKFCWKAIGFALICGKFSMKLDALIDLSGFIPQYESVLYKYKAY